MELQGGLEQIESRGVTLWTISPDDVDRLKSFRDSEGIEFPILSDPDSATIVGYGILNEDDERRVPHPTTLIVDREGIVRFRRTDTNYRVRPPLEEILEALDALDGGQDTP